jgi:hypothetical protein
MDEGADLCVRIGTDLTEEDRPNADRNADWGIKVELKKERFRKGRKNNC